MLKLLYNVLILLYNFYNAHTLVPCKYALTCASHIPV